MDGLAYKANAAEVFDRLRLLTARQAQDRIFAAFILPTQAMKDFQKQYSGGFSTEYPDPQSGSDSGIGISASAARSKMTASRPPTPASSTRASTAASWAATCAS